MTRCACSPRPTPAADGAGPQQAWLAAGTGSRTSQPREPCCPASDSRSTVCSSTPTRCRSCPAARSRWPGTTPPARSARSRAGRHCATGSHRGRCWPATLPRAGTAHPGVRRAIQAAAGRMLPLGLGGQPLAGPGREGQRVLEAHVHDRVIAQVGQVTVRPGRVPPVGARDPGPPPGPVVERHRPGGGAKTSEPGTISSGSASGISSADGDCSATVMCPVAATKAAKASLVTGVTSTSRAPASARCTGPSSG